MTTDIIIKCLRVCKQQYSFTVRSVGKLDYGNGKWNFLNPWETLRMDMYRPNIRLNKNEMSDLWKSQCELELWILMCSPKLCDCNYWRYDMWYVVEYVACRDPFISVKGSGHRVLWVYIVVYIYIYIYIKQIWRAPKIHICDGSVGIFLNSITQFDVRYSFVTTLELKCSFGQSILSKKIPVSPSGTEPATFRILEPHLNHCATVQTICRWHNICTASYSRISL